MIRSLLLTFRIHRFEVLLAVGLMVLTTVSALIATSNVTAAYPTQSCWAEWVETGGGIDMVSGECRRMMFALWGAQEEPGFISRPIAVLLPWIVGLLLGVPVVGRELEARTASLSWSLTGRRTRWLISRSLPMVLVGVVGMAVVSVAVASMAVAAEPFTEFGVGRLPDLGDLGSEGPTMVSRMAAAFGVGLLAGAVLGRTTVAFATGAVLSLLLFFTFGPGLQAVVAEQTARWAPIVLDENDEGPYNIRFVESGYAGSDGTILSRAEVRASFADVCPGCFDEQGLSRSELDRQREFWENLFAGWRERNFEETFRTVLPEAYGTFETAETLLGLGVGAFLILLTFPVVSRRRPA